MTVEDPLERTLRAALRPLEPGAAFTAALQARLAGAAFGEAAGGRHRQGRFAACLALAACLVVALGIAAQLQELDTAQRAAQASERQQAQARGQLLLALEITSERLTLVQQRIEQFQIKERNP